MENILPIIVNYAVELIVFVAMSVLLPKLVRYLGVTLDDKTRGYVETALRNAATFAVSSFARKYNITYAKASQKVLSDKNAFSEMQQMATRYVISTVPDGLEKLKVQYDTLDTVIKPRLIDEAKFGAVVGVRTDG